jgi:hypothetical protein
VNTASTRTFAFGWRRNTALAPTEVLRVRARSPSAFRSLGVYRNAVLTWVTSQVFAAQLTGRPSSNAVALEPWPVVSSPVPR